MLSTSTDASTTTRYDSGGANVGGTLFVPVSLSALGVGISFSVGAVVIRPNSSDGILDAQLQLNISVSPLFGMGLAAYANASPVIGSSNTAIDAGFSSDATFHAEGGFGFGSVSSGSADWKPGDSWSASVPTSIPRLSARFGTGGAAYGAIGGTATGAVTTPPLSQIPFIPVGPILVPNPFYKPKG